MDDWIGLRCPEILAPGFIGAAVFFALWRSDSSQRHALYWGIALLLLSVVGLSIPMGGLADIDSATHYAYQAIAAFAGIAAWFSGTLAYGHHPHPLRYGLLLWGTTVLIVFAVGFIDYHIASWVFTIASTIVFLLVAWRLRPMGRLERFAALLFLLRAIDSALGPSWDGDRAYLKLMTINGFLYLGAALALATAAFGRSVDNLQRMNRVLALVHTTVDRLSRLGTREALATEAGAILYDGTDCDQVALYLSKEADGNFQLAAQNGYSLAGANDLLPVAPRDSVVAIAIRAGHAVEIPEFDSWVKTIDPRTARMFVAEGIQGGIVASVQFGDRRYGTFGLTRRKRRAYSDGELMAYQSVGEALGLALANAEQREHLEHQALHDGLTNLPNREALHTRFDERRDALGEDFAAALLLIDLDRFKEINDTLGHHTGDELLKHLGSRLRHLLGERDGMVCRLGGDDFAIVIFGSDATEKAEKADALAGQVLAKLQQPVEVGGMSLAADATIGIALAPRHGTDSRELLRCAEVAMYHGKGAGSTITVYGPELDPHTRERLQLMTDLRLALSESQLRLHYQPKIDIGSGKVTGVEALIRWQHPSLGFIAPGRFMPMAEVSPLINQITNWVADTAIRQIQAWQARGIDLSIAINVSSRNLVHSGWSDELIDRVRQSGITPELLELEITETVLMQDPAASRATLEKIAQAGIGIAIDDFGTGYSSLSYLQKLPIRALKIDRSFVMHLDEDVQSRRIVETIIGLARGLQLRTVAEGIERAPSLEILRELGCDTAQGYLFAKPMPVEDLEAWLADRAAGGNPA